MIVASLLRRYEFVLENTDEEVGFFYFFFFLAVLIPSLYSLRRVKGS